MRKAYPPRTSINYPAGTKLVRKFSNNKSGTAHTPDNVKAAFDKHHALARQYGWL